MGEFVEARKDESQPFRSAQIVAVHKTGLYDVSFLDKGEALDLSIAHIRKIDDARNENRGEASSVSTPKKKAVQTEASIKLPFNFRVGEQVEALRNELWRFAIISAIHEDTQTVDVIFSDHYRESNMPIDKVRSLDFGPDPLSSSTATTEKMKALPISPRAMYNVGMPIEARYQGGSFYYPAVILRIDFDKNLVDLLYEDGMSETNVPLELIQRRPTKKNSNANISSSSTSSSRKDGSSPNAQSVPLSTNNHKNNNNQAEDDSPVKYPVGTRVQVNYLSKGRYYPAVIVAIHSSGMGLSYDIDYDDGEKENHVKEENIRPSTKPSFNKNKDPSDMIDPNLPIYQEGQVVEVNYQGKGDYYPGKIAKDYGTNKLYDILYDDGDRERRVKNQFIRLPTSKASTTTSSNAATAAAAVVTPSKIQPNKTTTVVSKYPEGTAIEAKYRNKGRYFAGIIKKSYGNGYYDIDYDDGEKENNVSESLIRSIDSLLANSQYDVGDYIEGNYRNQGKFFPGKIIVNHQNNLYDILYDDGEIEKNVRNIYIHPNLRPQQPIITPNNNHNNNGKVIEPKYPIGLIVQTNYNTNHPDDWQTAKIWNVNIIDNKEIFYSIKFPESSNPHQEYFNIPESNIRMPKLTNNNNNNNNNNNSKTPRPQINRSPSTENHIISSNHSVEEDVPFISPTKVPRAPANTPMNHQARTSRKPANQQQLQQKNNAARDEKIRVEANFQNTGEWYPGSILRENIEDGTVDIQYDDGDIENNVPFPRVRLVAVTEYAPGGGGAGGSTRNNNNNNNNPLPTNRYNQQQQQQEQEEIDSILVQEIKRAQQLQQQQQQQGGSVTSTPTHVRDWRQALEQQSNASNSSLYEINSLVEVKDFRSSNQNKWIKGRIIEIDYDQELCNLRLLSRNEILSNVSFEEIRLLRVTRTTNNTPRIQSTRGKNQPPQRQRFPPEEDSFLLNPHHLPQQDGHHIEGEEEENTPMPTMSPSTVPYGGNHHQTNNNNNHLNQSQQFSTEEIRQLKAMLLEKNSEISQLKNTLQFLQTTIQFPNNHNMPMDESARLSSSFSYRPSSSNGNHYLPQQSQGVYQPRPPSSSGNSNNNHAPSISSSGNKGFRHLISVEGNNNGFGMISPQKPPFSNSSAISQFDAFPPSAAVAAHALPHHHQHLSPPQIESYPNVLQIEMDQLRSAHQEDKEKLSFLQDKYSTMVSEFFAVKSREEQLMNQYKQLKQSHEELIMKLKEKINFY